MTPAWSILWQMDTDRISPAQAADLLGLDEARLMRYVSSDELRLVDGFFYRSEVLAFRDQLESREAALNEMLGLSERNGWGNR